MGRLPPKALDETRIGQPGDGLIERLSEAA
jgi:hypothetical protein